MIFEEYVYKYLVDVLYKEKYQGESKEKKIDVMNNLGIFTFENMCFSPDSLSFNTEEINGKIIPIINIYEFKSPVTRKPNKYLYK